MAYIGITSSTLQHLSPACAASLTLCADSNFRNRILRLAPESLFSAEISHRCQSQE
jgi:hypothetical protein